MTDFTPGETVVGESGAEYEVMFGPYPVFDAPTYLVKNEHGSGVALPASALKRKPADPRREVVARWLYDDDSDGRNDWDSVKLPDCRNAYYESADSLLAALDASTPARYRDCEEDVWEVQPDGRPMLVEYADGSDVDPGCYNDSVSELETAYGPLIRL